MRKSDQRDYFWIMVMIAIAFAIALILGIREANAHHKPQHREVFVGEFTEMHANVVACRSKEAAETIFESAKEHGQQGYLQALQVFTQMGVCLSGQSLVRVDEVLDQFTDKQHNVVVTLVRFTLKAREESPPLWSVLVGLKITPLEDKCVDCVAS